MSQVAWLKLLYKDQRDKKKIMKNGWTLNGLKHVDNQARENVTFVC